MIPWGSAVTWSYHAVHVHVYNNVNKMNTQNTLNKTQYVQNTAVMLCLLFFHDIYGDPWLQNPWATAHLPHFKPSTVWKRIKWEETFWSLFVLFDWHCKTVTTESTSPIASLGSATWHRLAWPVSQILCIVVVHVLLQASLLDRVLSRDPCLQSASLSVTAYIRVHSKPHTSLPTVHISVSINCNLCTL